MATLEKELKEALDAVFAPDQLVPLSQRIYKGIVEVHDVVGVYFDAIDQEKRADEFAAFQRDLVGIVQSWIDQGHVRIPALLRPALPGIVVSAVGILLESTEEGGQTVLQWAREKLLPFLRGVRGLDQVIDGIVAALEEDV